MRVRGQPKSLFRGLRQQGKFDSSSRADNERSGIKRAGGYPYVSRCAVRQSTGTATHAVNRPHRQARNAKVAKKRLKESSQALDTKEHRRTSLQVASKASPRLRGIPASEPGGSGVDFITYLSFVKSEGSGLQRSMPSSRS